MTRNHPHFRVLITRNITQSTFVTVQARDKTEAAELALELARTRPQDWQDTENPVPHEEIYLGDGIENDVEPVIGYVIYAASEHGYWSNTHGWTCRDEATVFEPDEVAKGLSLPVASGHDARLVALVADA